MLHYLDTGTLLGIAHLIGVAVGVGGAIASDLLFFKSIKDGRLSDTEFQFLILTSKMVWAGLIILVISGLGLFALDTEKYLASSKFLVKMVVVGVIVINGFFFHFSHIPRLKKYREMWFTTEPEFMQKRSLLLSSGAISITSWMGALVLGSLKQIPHSFTQGVIAYAIILLLAVCIANRLKNKLIPEAKPPI